MKKKLTHFFPVILSLFFFISKAQTSDCGLLSNPLNCNISPVIPILGDENIATELGVKYAQKNKIFDISYYNSDQFLSDCGTVAPYSCTSDLTDMLTYDVYFPSPGVYSCYRKNPLPAIVLFHGGGFSDCSSPDGTGGIAQYCMEFAKRGFIAFNVQYRTGRIKDPQSVAGETGNYMSASNFLAIYRAYQDARGSVRSILSRQLSNTPPPYRIDPDNIYVGGVSAGGFVALSLAYYTPDMLYEIFGDAQPKLGSLNENAYKGSPDINFKIKGVLNLWGGTYIPAAYGSSVSGFFVKNIDKRGNSLNPPMIAFQGAQDNVVPVKKANVYYSVSSSFIKTKVCTDAGDTYYSLSNNDTDKARKDLIMYGSQNMYDLLTGDLRIPCELYLDSDMQHGLSDKSDFGTNANVKQDKTAIIPYFVQRAIAFFQAVSNDFSDKLIDTRFSDCENFRVGCSPANNHEDCSSKAALLSSSASNILLQKNGDKIFTVSQSNRSILISLNKEGSSDILLTDLYGNPVKQLFANHANRVTINAANAASGVYVLSVQQNGQRQTTKISLY
ncbi:MAG TPA: T9SS type A sorting domain-containing protein [Panacibacter sp.]|nr:T9SS type A sorting domain-containing protein [Panacibacter sp.]HNP45803.1 T9SS type A sorting domain-containing protein [Panacibacter sp.]